MYSLRNVKISIKIEGISLNTVSEVCLQKSLDYKKYENFIVVKNKFTFIIFKNNKKNINHVNITKIPTIDAINESLLYLKECGETIIIRPNTMKIDNLTATTNLNKEINLPEFVRRNSQIYNIKYINEKFPGLFIKFEKGTIILFHTGKVVLIGSKTESDLECLNQKIHAITNMKL